MRTRDPAPGFGELIDRSADAIFAGGGEMGALMRTVDWNATPLGPPSGWPQSLRTALSICLASRFPMLIWWGRELVKLYNDAYRPMLGATKHPRSMGQAGKECWPEIWDIIGPMLEEVLTQGKATWSDNQLLPLDRNGYVEECYFTFSYSPIRDESGGIGGVFTAVTETTERVIGERRLRVLQEVANRAVPARSVDEAISAVTGVLAAARDDVPFALLYMLDDDRRHAGLVGSTALTDVGAAAPDLVDLGEGGGVWPLAEATRTGQPVIVHHGTASEAGPVGGREPVLAEAVVLPVAQAGQEAPAALLVAGASPRKALDGTYLAFLQLLAGQIAAAINGARAHEEERKRTEALAEIDRAKTAFFSNISHEFRTPLTLLLGPLDDALADPSLEAGRRDRLEIVRRNGLRLLKLVNTLLDFARIEAGRIEAAYEPLDLATVTAELASLFRSAIERAGLRLTIDCPPLPEPVYVDRAMWEKIVFNLLSNALKFTSTGKIAVTVRPAADRAELVVRDTGVGIPESELPQLFSRFHRAQRADGRTFEGTGIGLALVDELVRLHGGTVDVSSEQGRGTTFTVSLPLGRRHLLQEHIRKAPAASAPALVAEPYLAEAWEWAVDVPSAENMPLASGPLSRALAETPDRTHILIVDDNADMRDYLLVLLEEHYSVEAAADGLAALAAIRVRRPDLILSDIMMPRMDGIELIRSLRRDPTTATISVILLSARAGEEAAVEGLQAGADDYLVKPFSARELLARVKAHVDMARMRAAVEQEKDYFVSEVAHDLKAPLTTIKGFTQLLQRHLDRYGVLEPERAAGALYQIERTATRLARQIAELQDITLIRAGQPLLLQTAPLDLVQLVDEVVAQHGPAAADHRLELNLPSEPLMVMGDAARLERVLSNLLSNAVKYSPEDTTVRITAERGERDAGPLALITVTDQGIGIPARDLPHVFDRFTRAKNVPESIPGTGIGLASVRQIVEQHGGWVEVTSRENEGSTFSIGLPLAAPA